MSYTPAEVGGDFLTDAVAVPTTSEIVFRRRGANFTALLSVTLDVDNVVDSTGKIQVSLNPDPLLYDTYTILSGSESVATATISDVNSLPILFFSNLKPSVTEEIGSGEIDLIVNLSAAAGQEVSITYETEDGSASAGSDYTSTTSISAPATIRSSYNTAKISIPILNDRIHEGNEEFKVKITAVTNAILLGNARELIAVVTIVDNETPTLTIANSNLSVLENVSNGKVDILFSLSGVTNRDVIISYETENNSALSGSDFTGVSRGTTTTIGAGDLIGMISILITNDEIIESSEDFKVKFTGVSNAVFAGNASILVATVSIENDDSTLPILSIAASKDYFPESSSANFTITANVFPTQSIIVNYTPAEVGEGDFLINTNARSTNSTALIFTTNSPYSANLSIQLDNDLTAEHTGSIMVTLNADPLDPDTYLVTDDTNASAIATILDDDAPVLTIAAQQTSIMEVDPSDSTAKAIFTLTSRVNPRLSTFNVYYTKEWENLKLYGRDYLKQSSVTFSASGDVYTANLEVDIASDNEFKANYALHVVLSPDEDDDINYYVGTPSFNKVEVIDDDHPGIPTLTLLWGGPISAENRSLKFFLRSDIDPGGPIVVRYKLTEPGYWLTRGPGDYISNDLKGRPLSTSLTFTNISHTSVPEYHATINVPVINDTIPEVTGWIRLTLLTNSGVYNGGSPFSSDYRHGTSSNIFDNDAPLLSIIALGSNILEGDPSEPGVTAKYRVTSAVEPATKTIRVYYSVSGGSYVANSGQIFSKLLTFRLNGGQYSAEFEVPIISDNVSEADGILEVNLLHDSVGIENYRIGTPLLIVEGTSSSETEIEIHDDDFPTLTIAAVKETFLENERATFTVTASNKPWRSMDISYSGERVSGGDFLMNNRNYTTLTFSNTSPYTANFSFQFENDSVPEETGLIRVKLEGASNHQVSIPSGDGSSALVTVLDDDAPSLTIVPQENSVTEGDPSDLPVKATFTVISQVNLISNSLNVYYTPTSSNYIANSGVKSQASLTFRPSGGVYSANLEIEILSDEVSEENGSITVLLNPDDDGTVNYFVGEKNSAKILIFDDDDVPTLTVPSNISVGESDGSVLISVSLNNPSSTNITLNYSTRTGTASNADFAAQNLIQHTIYAGSTEARILIPITADEIKEVNEQFAVKLTDLTRGIFVGAPEPTVIITIIDDDPDPVLTIATGIHVDESEGSALISATLDGLTEIPVTFSFSTTTDSASGDDFTQVSSTLHTINPGEPTPILIPIIPDEIDEENEQFTVTYSNLNGATFVGDTAPYTTIVIIDDDQASFHIEDSFVTEGNVGFVDMLFTVSLSNISSRNTGVTWMASTESENDATFGTDYAITKNSHSGIARISAGNSSTTIRVPIASDIFSELNETFTVHLTNPTSGADIVNATATGTIIDDDLVPILSVSNTSISIDEGDDSVLIATILDKVSAEPVSVKYSTTSGTALAGSDFIAQNNRTHNIPSLTTADSLTIPIINDAKYEANESFTVTLSSPNHAVFNNNSTSIVITITITDNDLPTLTFETTNFRTSEDVGNFVIDVVLSSPAKEEIAFDVAVGGGTATKDSDYLNPTTNNVLIAIDARRGTITIPILEDNDLEHDETFLLTLSNLSGAKFSNWQSSILKNIAIIDNDPGSLTPNLPILSPTAMNFSVSEDVFGGNIVVGLELSSAAKAMVTFQVGVNGGTATKGEDFQDLITNFHHIPEGGEFTSISIPIINDVENEGNETFNLAFSNLGGAKFDNNNSRETLVKITIIDDDKPILSFTESSVSVAESDVNNDLELMLNLSNPILNPVDVYYSTLGETAYAGLDFVGITNGKVTIAPNTTSIPITIEVKGDTENEGNETFKVVVASPPSNAVFAAGVDALETTITITDNELPIISVNYSTLKISEKAGTTKIGLNLSGPSNADIEVSYVTSIEISDNTEPEDFTAFTTQSPGSVTIASSNSSRFIEIAITDDDISEDFETFTVTLSVVSGAVFVGGQNNFVFQVTIIDDEALPVLTLGAITSSEASRAAEIPISLDKASEEDIHITYSTTEGTATEGLDFTKQTNATYSITTGTTGRIRIPVIDDNIYEGDNERFTVTITEISGAAYGVNIINTPLPVSINDDEVKPTLYISTNLCEDVQTLPTNVSVSEASKNLVFYVKLSHPSQVPVTFDYNTIADTGTDTDFLVSSSEQYTIYPDGICTEVMTPITLDDVDEHDEYFDATFNSTFTTFSGGVGSAPVRVRIMDDDQSSFRISDTSVSEGDPSDIIKKFMTFNVNLTNPSSRTTEVTWTASTESGNAATFGVDYAAERNTHTGIARILPGFKTAMIRVPVTGDKIFEPNETFTVTLSNATEGATIIDSTAIGTIINDDPDPTLNLSATASVRESDRFLPIDATLSHLTTEEVTLIVSTGKAGDTAIGGSDYTTKNNATFTIPALASSASVLIPIIDDSVYEGLETFTITLESIEHAIFVGEVSTYTITVTITDDESSPQILFADMLPSVSESAGTITLSPTLNTVSKQAISAEYSTSDGTADAGSSLDYIAISSGTINFTAGQTSAVSDITITINQDSDVEGNETFTVNLTNPSGATIANTTITVTIVDDEQTVPTLSLTNTEFNLGESDGNFVVNVSLTSVAEVAFDVALSGGTAISGTDYTNNYATPTTKRVSISSGTTGSITIPITDDSLQEGNETFDLTLLNLTGAVFLNSMATLTQTITIRDDEKPLVNFINTEVMVAENVNGGMVNLEVNLSGTSSNVVTLNYQTSSAGVGAATANSDFTGTSSGSETISANTLTGMIQIPILNDNLDEPNESFTVTITSSSSNAELGSDLSVIVTITDEDVPTLSISTIGPAKEGKNPDNSLKTADFTITSNILPHAGLMIRYLPESTRYLPFGISSKIQTSDPLNFTPNSSGSGATATLSVDLDDDMLPELNGFLMITLQDENPADVNYMVHDTNNNATVTVEDDDSKVPVLVVSGLIGGVAESAGEAEFTITAYEDQTKALSINPGRSITIQYTPDEVNSRDFLNNAVAGVDKTAVLNFVQSGGDWIATFAVDLDNDTAPEETGKIEVTLNEDPESIDTYTISSTNADQSAEAIIWDDDAPELSIVAGPAVTESPNARATFKVISNVMPSAATIPIQYTPVGVTYIAGSGAQVIANPGVSFVRNVNTGKYEGIIEVDIVDDDLNEPDSNVQVH